MNKELRILYVEDLEESRNDLIDLLSGEVINGYTISCDGEASFDMAVNRCDDYHIVILDVFQGEATQGGVDLGSGTFEKIKEKIFVPVIFYSGYTRNVAELRSQVVGVAHKGEGGYDELKTELERLTKHKFPFLKENIHSYFEKEYKNYFWNVIQERNNIFTPADDDYSLGYMLLRNIADSLSKHNIKQIIGDDSILEEKAHPMEFYIYPTNTYSEYECGELLQKENDKYVILTPTCDFILRSGGKRKVDDVVLLETILLQDTDEYKQYKKKIENAKGDMDKINNARNVFSQFLRSGKSDRYFFLPKTPFTENRIVDFQKKVTVDYSQLKLNYTRIAKLDNPFAQSMVASYIRYYNRIGFPDLDTDYIIGHLNQ